MQHSHSTAKPKSAAESSSIRHWLISYSQEISNDVQWPDSTHQPRQLHIPAEILIRIFHYACDKEAPSHWIDFQDDGFKVFPEGDAKDSQEPLTAISLMLTCRRFKDLVEPLFYSRIFIIKNVAQGVRSYRNLLNTLNARPDLCQYVQCVQLMEASSDSLGEVEDILGILHKINPREVFLQGYGHRIDPHICGALTRFEIRTLHASDEWCQFAFEYLQSSKGSSLRHLSLRSCFQIYDIDDEPLRRIPIKQNLSGHGKSFNIKTLEIIGGDFVLNGLEYFCQRIPALTVFTLKGMLDTYATRCMRKFTQPFINIHQRTLEVIHLPITICKCQKIPDIAKCVSLKRLSVFWDNLSCEDAKTAMRRIERAPLLEHIIIHMDVDVSYTSAVFFDDHESRWLTKFVSSRKADNQLKHIHVIVDNEMIVDGEYLEYFGEDEEISHWSQPWPYHHLYLLKPVLLELGVSLSWSQPLWSESQWHERVSKLNRKHKQLRMQTEFEEQGYEASWIQHEIDIACRSELPRTPPTKDSTQKRIDNYFAPQAPHE